MTFDDHAFHRGLRDSKGCIFALFINHILVEGRIEHVASWIEIRLWRPLAFLPRERAECPWSPMRSPYFPRCVTHWTRHYFGAYCHSKPIPIACGSWAVCGRRRTERWTALGMSWTQWRELEPPVMTLNWYTSFYSSVSLCSIVIFP